MTRPYRYITRQRADVICPECAGPKTRQAKRCAECYYAARKRGEYPNPKPMFGPDNPKWKASGHTGRRKTGGSKGRQQPLWHPWRRENELLFVRSRVLEMADRGIRPATAGGRVRAHFATLDPEEAA